MASSYSTTQGDTWDIISLKVYGTELFTDRLVAANFAHRKTAVFGAGIVLTVPTVTEAERDDTNRPPWRRSS